MDFEIIQTLLITGQGYVLLHMVNDTYVANVMQLQ